MVVTEALAEIKTLNKRIEKKREAIGPYLLRRSVVLDPIKEEGGSSEFIRRERQAIEDLERRVVAIRTAIQKSNHVTSITIEGQERTIAEWLTWRKEIAPGRQTHLGFLRTTITKVRAEYQKKGGVVEQAPEARDENVIVGLDEIALLKEIEQMENILGQLDGLLSVKNATVMLDVAQ